jgi:hypothetical protein
VETIEVFPFIDTPVEVRERSSPISFISGTKRPYYMKIGQDSSYPTFTYNGHNSLVLKQLYNNNKQCPYSKQPPVLQRLAVVEKLKN